jgi:hypothetical protein
VSARASSNVWTLRGLTATEKLILLAIADISDDEGNVLENPFDVIAAKCELPERDVHRTIAELASRSYVQWCKPGFIRLAVCLHGSSGRHSLRAVAI